MRGQISVGAVLLALAVLPAPSAAQSAAAAVDAEGGTQAAPAGAAAHPKPDVTAKHAARVKGETKAGRDGKAGKAATGKAATGEAKAAAAPPPWMAADPGRATQMDGSAAAHGDAVSHRPVDPLEIGGKWTGSNSSAAQTRSENYNGAAEGAGGSVGLKLHF